MTDSNAPKPSRRHRILVAKPGLDGHDRGAKVVVRALTEAGYEVIYTGLHQDPEAVVEAALQEDVEAVGLSILSGAHMTLFPVVMEGLKREGLGDVLVFGGGIIPPQDEQELKNLGVGAIFGPGTSTQQIVEFLDRHFAAKEARGV
ncbi:MAG: methylmalonyl-CoA mutase [Planctomycetota bacterium]